MFFLERSKQFKHLTGELSENRQKVAVIGHMRPDGDCVGSQVGLCRVLNQLGIQAVAINQDPVPETLAPFIGDTPWSRPNTLYTAATHVAILVDCADAERCGAAIREAFPQPLINIDHHISNEGYARSNLIEAQASATAEILAGMFLDLDVTIDPVTAQALYVGIATDTGQFRFPSTSPRVFKICSELIDRGANPNGAAQALYENQTFNQLDLLQRFLRSLRIECSGRVCIGRLTRADYNDTQALREDAEGFVDYARSIQGVDIGVLMEERDDGIKCSLRAKRAAIRVDKLAQVFGGGGHACAAGLYQPSVSIDTFHSTFLQAIEAHLTATV